MSFVRDNYSSLKSREKSELPGLSSYSTSDNAAAVMTAGYLNPIRDVVCKGDVILVAASDSVFFAVVGAVTATTVTITKGTVVSPAVT